MKLWLLKDSRLERLDSPHRYSMTGHPPDWPEDEGCIIRAETSEDACDIARKHGGAGWLGNLSCKQFSNKGEPGVLLWAYVYEN